ncbi:hypothetical protein BT96DRAFT_1102827, partial [Gymnopus androsaceus JB14]
MAKYPTVQSLGLPAVDKRYLVPFFRAALAHFIVQLHNLTISGPQLEAAALDIDADFTFSIAVYHLIKYTCIDPVTHVCSTADSIHVQPAHKDCQNCPILGRFDTALIRVRDDTQEPVKAFRVGQVHLVFSLPLAVMSGLCKDVQYANWPKHLAYIEWLTPFSRPGPNHCLHKITCSFAAVGGNLASVVVDLKRVVRSVPLMPNFGKVADRSWTSSNVMDKCKSFFVNPFLDQHDHTLYNLS